MGVLVLGGHASAIPRTYSVRQLQKCFVGRCYTVQRLYDDLKGLLDYPDSGEGGRQGVGPPPTGEPEKLHRCST
jgi:hypothetical protein